MSKRDPKVTICPLIFAALIIAAKNRTQDLEEDARCLGRPCQMYDTGTERCGLRFR